MLFFLVGLLVVNFILPIEYVGIKWRAFCGCIGAWAIGVMLLALVANYVRDWRHLSLIVSCGGIPLLFTWW